MVLGTCRTLVVMNVMGRSLGLWEYQNENGAPTKRSKATKESPSVASNFSDFSRILNRNMNRKSGWTYSMIRGRLDSDFKVLITFPKKYDPLKSVFFFSTTISGDILEVRHLREKTQFGAFQIGVLSFWIQRSQQMARKWPKTLRCFYFFVGNWCWDVGMLGCLPLFLRHIHGRFVEMSGKSFRCSQALGSLLWPSAECTSFTIT